MNKSNMILPYHVTTWRHNTADRDLNGCVIQKFI